MESGDLQGPDVLSAFFYADVGDVGPVDVVDKPTGLGHSQRIENSGLHLSASRGGEGKDRGIAEALANFSKAGIVGAKSVTPAVNAVRLVNHKEGRMLGRQAPSLCRISQSRGIEPFGGNVEEF